MSTRLMWLLFHTGSKIRLANRSPSTSSTVCLARKWSMRNTSRSSNDRAISAFSAFASSRSVPNGFSTTSVVCGGQARPGQRLERRPEQHVRQRQVHRHRCGGALERRAQGVRRRDVRLPVRHVLQQGVRRLLVAVRQVRVQLLPGVRPVGLVVARVAVHGEDRGVGGQPSGAGEPDEGR